MPPWRAKSAMVVRATRTAYGCSRSSSDAVTLRSPSMGTPEMTLPNATPISSAAPKLAALKTTSQLCRQRGDEAARAEDDVPALPPARRRVLAAELDRDRPADQREQQQHERGVEARE